MCLNLKVYTEWKEIAEVLRDRVFKENEQHLIDIFDIKVWHQQMITTTFVPYNLWFFLIRVV